MALGDEDAVSGFLPPQPPPNYPPEVKRILDLQLLYYAGYWDVEHNLPKVYSEFVPMAGTYRKIIVPGTFAVTSFNHETCQEEIISDWKPGDIIISDGKYWFKSKLEILRGLGFY